MLLAYRSMSEIKVAEEVGARFMFSYPIFWNLLSVSRDLLEVIYLK